MNYRFNIMILKPAIKQKSAYFILLVLVLLFMKGNLFATDYYVNDNVMSGEMWCTVIGNDGNLGTSPDAPKLTIQNVIDTYFLGQGDRVFVDTGTYNEMVLITDIDDGSGAGYVTFTASTQGGGAVIDGAGNAQSWYLTNCQYVRIEYFKITGGNENGIFMLNGSKYNYIYRNEIYNAGSTAGISIDGSPDNIIYRNTVYNCALGINIFNADRSIICRNIVYNNSDDGIQSPYTDDSDNCKISQNIVYKNIGTKAGIRTCGTGNIFYNNTSVSNNKSGQWWRGDSQDIKNTITAWNGNYGYELYHDDTITYCGSYQDGALNQAKLNSGDFLSEPTCTTNDPMFVNSLADLHLKWNSTLQDAGENGASMGRYSTRIVPVDNLENATTTYTNIFNTTYAGPIPADGIIYFQYAAGFSYSGVSAAAIMGLDGSLTALDMGGGLVRITRSGGSASTAGDTVKIVLNGVVNPIAGASNYRAAWWTTDSSTNIIDDWEDSNEFIIVSLNLPDCPTNLIVTNDPLDYVNIDILWNDSGNETSYTLFRNTANNTNTATNIAGFSANITNYINLDLAASTTYYYWVKAYNANGSSGYSGVSSNTTVPSSSPFAPGSLTNYYSVEDVIISWTNVANETSYTLFRSTNNFTNSVSNIAGFGKNQTEYTDSASFLGKTNYYRVKAYNILGASGFSPAAPAYLPPPPAPTNLSATMPDADILLSWDDLASETSYTLFRNTTNDTAAATQIAGMAQDQTSYTDKNFTTNVYNYYWVKAYNGAGGSGFSSYVSNILLPPDAPAFLTNQNHPQGAGLYLEWTNVSRETSYTLFRSTNNNLTNAENILGRMANQTSCTAGIILYKTNYYWVKAYNRAGESGYSTNFSYFIVIPDQVSNLSANLPLDEQDIILFWDDLLNETSYTLYRSTNINMTNSWQTNIPENQTTFTDRNFLPDIYNYYWVKANNSAGTSPYSDAASNILIPPDIPSLLFASYYVYTNESAVLSWSNVSHETSYTLFRSTNIANTNNPIAGFSKNQTIYTDITSILGITNYYWIKAYNRAGRSGYSASAFCILLKPDQPLGLNGNIIATTTNILIDLSWNDLTTETAYTLFKSTNINITNAIAGFGPNQTFFTDANITTNETYYYWVKAYNSVGGSLYSAVASNITPENYIPSPPSLVSAAAVGLTGIKVTWTSVSDAKGYQVFRNTSDNSNTAQKIINLANVTNYADTAPSTNTTYYYWVKATNSGGSSGFSSPAASAKTYSSFYLEVKAESYYSVKKIVLKWNPPTGLSVNNYRIYRALVPVDKIDTNYLIVELANTAVEYEDTAIEYNKMYYYNVAYTINNVDYVLNIPAIDFVAIALKPIDLGFNSMIELIPYYDKIENSLREPAGHPLITGPLISAYKFVVYKLGPYSPGMNIIGITPNRGKVQLAKLTDGRFIRHNNAEPKIGKYRMQYDFPVHYVLCDMGEIVDIKKVRIGSSPDDNRNRIWKRLRIEIARREVGPYEFAVSAENPLSALSNEISIPEEKQEGRYVYIIFEESWSTDEDELMDFQLTEIEIESERHVKKIPEEDIIILDKINLALPYNDLDNNGEPEIYNSTENMTNVQENSLAVFILNGIDWDYLGGKVDQNNNIISFDSQNFGIFGIFPIDKNKIQKERISFNIKYMTADNDGIDDCLMIRLKPDKPIKVDIRIYNVSGRMVMDLMHGVEINSLYTIKWCGKNIDGENLKIGPYLYEIRFNGEKAENGVILIVK